MIEHETPTCLCPHCGRPTDRASGAGDRGPRPGSLALCVGCAGISVYDEDLRLRLPTADEQQEIDNDPFFAGAQERIRQGPIYKRFQAERAANPRGQ